MFKGNFKNGKSEGIFEYYHDNGQLSAKGNLKNGERDGVWEIYHKNGQLSARVDYKNGKKIGRGRVTFQMELLITRTQENTKTM